MIDRKIIVVANRVDVRRRLYDECLTTYAERNSHLGRFLTVTLPVLIRDHDSGFVTNSYSDRRNYSLIENANLLIFR